MTSGLRLMLFAAALAMGAASLAGEAVPAAPAEGAAPADEAGEVFNLANGYMAKQEYELAADTYARLLKAHPDFKDAARALSRQAQCLHALKRYAEAEAAAQSLLAKYPDGEDAPRALYLLGDCFLKQDKHAEGAKAFLLLVEKAPKYALAADALYHAGEALCKLKRFDDAIKAYAKLVAGHPDYQHIPYAHYSIGWCRQQLKDPKAAIEAFQTVVAKFPKSPVAGESQFRLGEAQLELKAYGPAVEAFRKALDGFPGPFAADALMGIGRAHFEQEHYAEAAKSFQGVVARFPDKDVRHQALYDAGSSLLYAGDAAAALKAFGQVLADVPDTPLADKARYARGHALLKLNKPEEAAEVFSQSLKAASLADLAPRVTFSLGEAHFAARRYDDAAKAYAAVVEKHPDTPVAAEALSALAFCRNEQKKLPEAIEAARLFTTRCKPDHPLYKATLLALGDFQFAAKSYADAKATLQRLIELGPPADKADWTFYRLGWCHRNLGEHGDAAKAFGKLLADHPKSDLAPEALCLLAHTADEQRQPDKAIELYNNCLKTYPDSSYAAIALFDLGVLELSRKDFPAAIAHLTAFIAKYPRHDSLPEAHLHLADALYDSKRYGDALKHFSAFLEKAPDHMLAPRARDGIAWCQRNVGQLDKALADFLAVAEQHPVGRAYLHADYAPAALFAAAAIRQEQKQHAEASKLFARVAADFPGHKLALEATYRAASSLLDAGQPAKAQEALQAFLEKNPKSDFTDKALRDLAWACREQKQAEPMVATLTRLLEEFPNSSVAPNAHFLFGEHLYDAKQYADAAKHYDACAKALKGEELAKALYKLAWCHYHSFDLAQDRPEKLEEAAATFSDLLRRVPESTFLAEAHYLIGLILQRQNKHQDAIAAFQKALASEPSPKHEEGALYQTGQSQQALGKWADALKSHKGTLEKFPDGEMKLDATYGVGLASQHLGAYADAVDAYKKVIAATKTELAARAQYGLGECDFLQEKYKDALARFLAIEITYAYDKWSAAALLKVAECHAKLGNADRARFYADDLAKKFPNSELLPQARKLVESLRAKKPD